MYICSEVGEMLEGMLKEFGKGVVGKVAAERGGQTPAPNHRLSAAVQRVGALPLYLYPHTTIMQVTSLVVAQLCACNNSNAPTHLNQLPLTTLSILICAANIRDVPRPALSSLLPVQPCAKRRNVMRGCGCCPLCPHPVNMYISRMLYVDFFIVQVWCELDYTSWQPITKWQ